MNCAVEFKLDGYVLTDADENEPNTWNVDIEAGSRALKELAPAPKAQPKKRGGGMGMGMMGMGALGDLINDYDNAAKSFTYKIAVEQIEQ